MQSPLEDLHEHALRLRLRHCRRLCAIQSVIESQVGGGLRMSTLLVMVRSIVQHMGVWDPSSAETCLGQDNYKVFLQFRALTVSESSCRRI